MTTIVHDDKRSPWFVTAVKQAGGERYHLVQHSRISGKLVVSRDTWPTLSKAKHAFSNREFEWYRKPV